MPRSSPSAGTTHDPQRLSQEYLVIYNVYWIYRFIMKILCGYDRKSPSGSRCETSPRRVGIVQKPHSSVFSNVCVETFLARRQSAEKSQCVTLEFFPVTTLRGRVADLRDLRTIFPSPCDPHCDHLFFTQFVTRNGLRDETISNWELEPYATASLDFRHCRIKTSTALPYAPKRRHRLMSDEAPIGKDEIRYCVHF